MDLGKDLKNLLLAGIGAVAVTAEKSQALLDELVKKGELTVEQGKVLNEELKHNVEKKIHWISCSGNRKKKESQHGSLHGARDVRDGTSSAQRCLRNT